jgi:hypothetical protein
LLLTPSYTFKKFKETSKEYTLNLWFLVGSLRKSASPLKFFSNTHNLKLLYSEVLIKTQGCLNLKIFKIQEPPNSALEGKERCGLSWLNIETTFASSQLVCDPAHSTATPIYSPFYALL